MLATHLMEAESYLYGPSAPLRVQTTPRVLYSLYCINVHSVVGLSHLGSGKVMRSAYLKPEFSSLFYCSSHILDSDTRGRMPNIPNAVCPGPFSAGITLVPT